MTAGLLRCMSPFLADFVAEVSFEGRVWGQGFLDRAPAMVLRPPCRLDGTDAFKPRRCTLNAVLRQRRRRRSLAEDALRAWLAASGFARLPPA